MLAYASHGSVTEILDSFMLPLQIGSFWWFDPIRPVGHPEPLELGLPMSFGSILSSIPSIGTHLLYIPVRHVRDTEQSPSLSIGTE